MASTILSRLLPSRATEPSIYETLRQQDDLGPESDDIERNAGMNLDEENRGTQSYDRGYDLSDSFSQGQDSPSATIDSSQPASKPIKRGPQVQTRSERLVEAVEQDDLDNEVPASLLVEEDGAPRPIAGPRPRRSITPPISSSSVNGGRKARRPTRDLQIPHQNGQSYRTLPSHLPDDQRWKLTMTDPKEQALWMWANVENLDNFLTEIYEYFSGNGIWCITLSRVLYLLTLAFVVAFSAFLMSCINYQQIPGSKTITQVLIPRCTQRWSGSTNLWIWLFAIYWMCKVFQCIKDLPRLRRLQNFYRYLLHVQDGDIQTVAWQEIVKKLMDLRDLNPTTAGAVKDRHRMFLGTQSKQRMDAHDIANRLMRRENYLIALINKDILDLTLPIPFLTKKQFFSKTLQWNLSMCILDHVFDPRGQVRPQFLKDKHRRALSESLKRRFRFAAFMNAVCAPFILIFFMLFYFFRYFNEYQRNPSQIGSRQYTPLAEWKFREFNELWHLFERRINMSYPFASRYLDQFPKDKTIQVAKFVAFVAGALASVLALASIVDPESLLAFEITPDRTVLFYLGVFGTLWAIARGAVPEDNVVFDPEFTLRDVVSYTHYMPSHWQDHLHTNEVRAEFAQLHKMKIFIFLEELLSILLTPFILWLSLPRCSDRLVDFFREFTVHVDGLGYVCSFAVFDFKTAASSAKRGANERLREDYYATKDNKMLASYYGFVDNYVSNQRHGAHFINSEQRQSFHAPPAFPGLATSVAGDIYAAGTSSVGRSNHPTKLTSRNHPAGVPDSRAILHYKSRTEAVGQMPSPIASVLLDPPHQAVNATNRPQRGIDKHSHVRIARERLSSHHEGDEESEGAAQVSIYGGKQDDDILSESWKTTRAGDRDDASEEGTRAASDERDPGVLGLVYQFSQAQADGRGTGVTI